MNRQNKYKAILIAYSTIYVVLFSGCDSTGDGLVKAGDIAVANGKLASAAVKYLDAIEKKNGTAYCRYGVLQGRLVQKELVEVSNEQRDYAIGYDSFLSKANKALKEGRELCAYAKGKCDPSIIKASLSELDKVEAALYDIKDKVVNAKIENGLKLGEIEVVEIAKAVNYSSNTGNHYVDVEKNHEQQRRFVDKYIIVAGSVKTVEHSLFVGPKAIIECGRKTISAEFEGMSEEEAARIVVGSNITIKGKVSRRPVLSDIAMSYCVIVE